MTRPRPATFDLCETFAAVQGEGFHLGEPCIFVRSAGCNLRCQWGATRCDTPYALRRAAGRPRTTAHVVAAVQRLARRYPTRHVVITGGEPLLQPALPALVRALRRRRFVVALETNGTIYRPLPADFVSLSPKLASSRATGVPGGGPRATAGPRLDLAVLRQWLRRHECQLKFVVHRRADEREIARIVAALGALAPPHRIYLMPQGRTARQLTARARLCIAIALRRGWRYTPRAHLEVFGNRRGK